MEVYTATVQGLLPVSAFSVIIRSADVIHWAKLILNPEYF